MNKMEESAWEETDDEGMIAMHADMHKNEIYLFFKFKNRISGKEFLDVVEEWVEQARAVQDHLFELHGTGPTDLN